MGVRSLSTSKGSLLRSPGTTVKLLAPETSSVWPSGMDLATASTPMTVAAPGLFSMMTACPRRGPRRSAIRRATVSVAPPGGNGTISLRGLLGQLWAEASGLTRLVTRAARAVISVVRRDVDVMLLSFRLKNSSGGSGGMRAALPGQVRLAQVPVQPGHDL